MCMHTHTPLCVAKKQASAYLFVKENEIKLNKYWDNMIQNMLLKEKENLGFSINQFTEAIFISALQITIFLPESIFISPYLLKDIYMEYVTPVARFVFSLMFPFCFVSVCALLLNCKLTALQHKLFFTVRITEFCG